MINEKLHQLGKISLTGENLFFAAFIVYVSTSFLQTSMYQALLPGAFFGLGVYIPLGMIAVKIVLFESHSSWRWLLELGLLFLSVVIYLQTKSSLPVIVTMFVFGADGIDFELIVRRYFQIGTTLMIFIWVSAITGVIHNLTYLRGTTQRHAFGIAYPTDFAAHLFFLIVAYCYLKGGKLNWKQYGVILVMTAWLKWQTDARLDVICILITLVAIKLYDWSDSYSKQHRQRRWFAITWFSGPVLAYLAIMGTIFFDPRNQIYQRINGLLSGRLDLGASGFSQYPVTPFGQQIVEHGWGGLAGFTNFREGGVPYFMLDSSFVRIILIYGVIFTLIILIGYATFSYRQVEQNQYLLPVLLTVILISSVVDQHLLELFYNPFTLCLLSAIPIDQQLITKKRLRVKS